MSIDHLHDISQITDFLFFLGSYEGTCHTIHEFGYVINCAKECDHHENLPDDVGYKKVELNDSTSQGMYDLFDEMVELLDSCSKDGIKTIIHCYEGKSRSVTFVLAYLMKMEGMKLKEAFEFVKERRSIILPNVSFMQQLGRYEETLYGTSLFDQEDYLRYFVSNTFGFDMALVQQAFDDAEGDYDRMIDLLFPF